MEILEYFSLIPSAQRHRASQIARGEWRAAQYLSEQLTSGQLHKRYGSNTLVFLLTQGDDLLAFCILADQDELPAGPQKPWIGFVYTFPRYRGNRFSQILIDHCCAQARHQGFHRIYLTSNEQGLYEKYGFRFLELADTANGEQARVFVRELGG